MEANKEQILETNEEVGKYFDRAYRFFKSAKFIEEDIVEIHKEAMDFGKVNFETYKLVNEIFGEVPVGKNTGEARHLFGSAYTPNGWVEVTDSILQDANKIYYIRGDIGTGKTTLLRKIYNETIVSGLNVEVYHAPLIPDKIQTVYIKDLDTALTISDKFMNKNYKTIDLNECLNNDIIHKNMEKLEEDKKVLKYLIDRGVENITMAKRKHDTMEEYYIPNMYFAQVDKLRDDIVERILKYEQ